MIDFTKCIEELNFYKGSEKKKTLIYEQKRYLVKFPDPIREKNKDISYVNNTFSEYIGSNIFKMIGFDSQNTILGTYMYDDKIKIVCACEDFTDDENALSEFEGFALSINPSRRISNELSDILEILYDLENFTHVNVRLDDNITEKFWGMFVIDGLIGNKDRHNENFGFLYNKKTRSAKFSPIYDCGSCLNPLLEDDKLRLLDDVELKNMAVNSYSCFTENGKRINYISYMKSMKNKECNEAILRIFNCIDINKILNLIDSIECISDIRKNFYKNILSLRYEIIKEIYEKIISKNKKLKN